MQAESKDQIVQRLGRFVRNPNFVLVMTGLVGSLAFLMLVCFLSLSWFGKEGNTISAVRIWLGGNDSFPSLGLTRLTDEQLDIEFVALSAEKGIAHVRFIDRMLFIVPLGVIALLVLVAMVILEKMPMEQALGSMVAVALLLFIFPFVWQSLSTSNWRDFLEDEKIGEVDDKLDQISELYSTGEQKLFGLLALLVSSAGYGLYVAEKQGWLGTGDGENLLKVEPFSSQEEEAS